jgi:hypothetical protein
MLLKSLLFKGIFLLFFTAFFSFSSFGQIPQAGLSSNPVDESDILQLCEGTAVSFTGFQGGLFDAPSLFELFVSFNFTAFRRINRGFFKRLQIDNYF